MSLVRNLYISLKRKIEHLKYVNRIKFWVDNGLTLGNNVTIMPTAYIDGEYGYLISIGNNCSMGHNTRIFGHDASPFKFTNGHTIMKRTVIHDNVYIGENVTILAGCSIGPNVLIASGSVINKDIPPNSCVAGVPARRYQAFDVFVEKHSTEISKGNVVEYADLQGPEYMQERQKIKAMLDKNGIAYVKGFPKNAFTVNGKDFER